MVRAGEVSSLLGTKRRSSGESRQAAFAEGPFDMTACVIQTNRMQEDQTV